MLVLGLRLRAPGATAQLASDSGLPDLARAQDYAAYRVSSTNPDPLSNDDSLRGPRTASTTPGVCGRTAGRMPV